MPSISFPILPSVYNSSVTLPDTPIETLFRVDVLDIVFKTAVVRAILKPSDVVSCPSFQMYA